MTLPVCAGNFKTKLLNSFFSVAISLRYREYKPNATRRTPVNPLSLNHAHDDTSSARPFDENDPYMPHKSSSSRYPMSAERADDWDVEFVTDVSVQADLDGGRRKAGAIDIRRNSARRITLSMIEDYEIGDLLGSGGFGKVFRAVGHARERKWPLRW